MSLKAKVNTREEWLQNLVEALKPMFMEAKCPIPPAVRVSCGWPSKAPLAKKRRIGECWPRSRSTDGHNEIFISPILDKVDLVSAVMVHELIHAWDDCENGHKGPFKTAMKNLGLQGKATSTEASEALLGRLRPILENLGGYPHSNLDKNALNNEKKPGSRLLKLVCPCGAILRGTRKVIDEVGLPTCACGEPFSEGE
jgi:hypothetical protein